MDRPTASKEPFRIAMRRLAGTACIVTAAEQDEWHGITATSVVSVSMDPPSLLACVNRSSSLFLPLCNSRRFCVNILGAEHEAHCVAFGSPSGREQRFQKGQWGLLHDLPYFSEAQACVFCSVAESVTHGTHVIFIGNVLDVLMPAELSQPLIYHNGRPWRHLGGIV
jgi:flavin reductase